MVHAQPECQHPVARQRRPHARHRRARAGAPAEQARPVARRQRHRRARAGAAGADRGARALAADPAGAHRGCAARALVLLGLPAQHLHARAGGLACDGRHRLPLHGDLDGPPDGGLHANGRRRRALGGAAALHERKAPVRQLGRWHLFPQRAAGDPASHCRWRQHHLQNFVQRRRGHDGRPAGGRAAGGALGAANRAQPARRRGAQAVHRHRRAGQVRPCAPHHAGGRDLDAAAGCAGAAPRRARPRATRVPRHRGRDRHHL
ncbi:hypothetical protein Tther_02591 [Tepidimonas thermarum]|uniref:Uncharacterized protein n=1 Tax=Tepidimonas thermarum TaxID=335431 RepID=A0A554WQ81_9BURK|nr:hypothetical protein Tther_02591 [Tepidimonas thermarum]